VLRSVTSNHPHAPFPLFLDDALSWPGVAPFRCSPPFFPQETSSFFILVSPLVRDASSSFSEPFSLKLLGLLTDHSSCFSRDIFAIAKEATLSVLITGRSDLLEYDVYPFLLLVYLPLPLKGWRPLFRHFRQVVQSRFLRAFSANSYRPPFPMTGPISAFCKEETAPVLSPLFLFPTEGVLRVLFLPLYKPHIFPRRGFSFGTPPCFLLTPLQLQNFLSLRTRLVSNQQLLSPLLVAGSHTFFFREFFSGRQKAF